MFQVFTEAAAEISGSVTMECVCHTDGAVTVSVTARMDLMRWTAVCIRLHRSLCSLVELIRLHLVVSMKVEHE